MIHSSLTFIINRLVRGHSEVFARWLHHEFEDFATVVKVVRLAWFWPSDGMFLRVRFMILLVVSNPVTFKNFKCQVGWFFARQWVGRVASLSKIAFFLSIKEVTRV